MSQKQQALQSRDLVALAASAFTMLESLSRLEAKDIYKNTNIGRFTDTVQRRIDAIPQEVFKFLVSNPAMTGTALLS